MKLTTSDTSKNKYRRYKIRRNQHHAKQTSKFWKLGILRSVENAHTVERSKSHHGYTV